MGSVCTPIPPWSAAGRCRLVGEHGGCRKKPHGSFLPRAHRAARAAHRHSSNKLRGKLVFALRRPRPGSAQVPRVVAGSLPPAPQRRSCPHTPVPGSGLSGERGERRLRARDCTEHCLGTGGIILSLQTAFPTHPQKKTKPKPRYPLAPPLHRHPQSRRGPGSRARSIPPRARPHPS